MHLGLLDFTKFLWYTARSTPWRRCRLLLGRAVARSGRGRLALALDCLSSVLRYQISPANYFFMRFETLTSHLERRTHVGGYVYKKNFRPRFNAPDTNPVFDDKLLFREHFAACMDPRWRVVRSPDEAEALASWLAGLDGEGFVLKPSRGTGGAGITVHSKIPSVHDLTRLLAGRSFPLLAEARLKNHPILAAISPDALNTLRVMTFLRADGAVEIPHAVHRWARNSTVDNTSLGGLATPVDLERGIIAGPAYGSLHTDVGTHATHPTTGLRFAGVPIPGWADVVDLVRGAAAVVPRARLIGWDVAVTPEGPFLVEGNSDPTLHFWQTDRGAGVLPDLERFVTLC